LGNGGDKEMHDGQVYHMTEHDTPKSFKRLMNTMNYKKKEKNIILKPQSSPLKIRNDESLKAFEDRVERECASDMVKVMSQSGGGAEGGSRKKEKMKARSKARKQRKNKESETETAIVTDHVKFGEVVKAPPTLLVVPKRVQKAKLQQQKSLYEQQSLALERDRVIQLYRKMKNK
jgi:hypothetical protein